MSDRQTALQHAMLRVVTFNDIIKTANSSVIYKILTDLNNSYYKLIINHSTGTSIVEILNKKIIAVYSSTSNEEYYINTKDEITSFLLTGISGSVSLAVEYYEYFKLDVVDYEAITEGTTTEYSPVSTNGKDFFLPIHSDDAYIKTLNVSETYTTTLSCQEIQLGNWKIFMSNPEEAIITTT